ncbi:MAG: CopG family transcriptional regulator [Alphaproteobacteria bacterium]|nr:CopG family transcriptional regulator [Alphaproteobacteria bacterium]
MFPMQIPFEPQIEAQLKALAAQTGKSEDFYVLQAVKNYLEDVADIAKAKHVLTQNNPTYTQDEIERELGFDFSVKN